MSLLSGISNLKPQKSRKDDKEEVRGSKVCNEGIRVMTGQEMRWATQYTETTALHHRSTKRDVTNQLHV